MDDDEDKIVPLRKGFVPFVIKEEPEPEAPTVDSRIVTHLEMLLEDAKSGDLQAIAVVALKEPDVMKCWYRSKPPFSNALLGAAQRLIGHMISDLNRDEF